MTIEQIQTAIDDKIDSRQIINMIADYIQANPDGGGGFPESITKNTSVDVGAWEFAFESNPGGDPTMEEARSIGEWYVSFVNGADQCTLRVTATNATLDRAGAGAKALATESLANGTFTTVDAKTVTVVNGIITAITD